MQAMFAGRINCFNCIFNICNRFHFGYHDMRQMMPRLRNDDVNIRFKSRVIQRMHSRSNAWSGFIWRIDCYNFCSIIGSIYAGYNHICMINFATNRCTILTIECDIKNAGAKLLCQLSLQLQTLFNSCFNATIVVTNW